MPCKIELPEIKVKLQKYSFLSEAFHEAFRQVLGTDRADEAPISKFPELPEVARYGYKNYATLGFAALYSNLTVEDDEEQTQENRGTLHEAASSLLPETFLAHVFKGLMGINEKYDFMNLRDIPEQESETEGPYLKLLRKYKDLVKSKPQVNHIFNFASELQSLIQSGSIEEDYFQEARDFFWAYSLNKADLSKLPEIYKEIKETENTRYLKPVKNFERIFSEVYAKPLLYLAKQKISESGREFSEAEKKILNSTATLNGLLEFEYASYYQIKKSNYASRPLIYGGKKFSENHESFEEGNEYKDPEVDQKLKEVFELVAIQTGRGSGKEIEKAFKKQLQNFVVKSQKSSPVEDWFTASVEEWIAKSATFSPEFKILNSLYKNNPEIKNAVLKSVFLFFEYGILDTENFRRNSTSKRSIARIWASDQIISAMIRGFYKKEPVTVSKKDLEVFNRETFEKLGISLTQEEAEYLKTSGREAVEDLLRYNMVVPSIYDFKNRETLYDTNYYKFLLSLGEELQNFNRHLDTVSVRFNQAVYYNLIKPTYTFYVLKQMEGIEDEEAYRKTVNYDRTFYDFSLDFLFGFLKTKFFQKNVPVYYLGTRSFSGDTESKALTDKDRYEFVLRGFFSFDPSVYVLYPPGDKKYVLAAKANSHIEYSSQLYPVLLQNVYWSMTEHRYEVSKINKILKEAFEALYDSERPSLKIETVRKKMLDYPLPAYSLSSVQYVLEQASKKEAVIDYKTLFEKYVVDISTGATFFYKFPKLNTVYLHHLFASDPTHRLVERLGMDDAFVQILQSSMQNGPNSEETEQKIKAFFDLNNFSLYSGTYSFEFFDHPSFVAFFKDVILPFFKEEAEETLNILRSVGVADNENTILDSKKMARVHREKINFLSSLFGKDVDFRVLALIYMNMHYYVFHNALGRYASVDPASCAKPVKYTLPEKDAEKKEYQRMKKTLLEAYNTLAKRSGVYSSNGFLLYPEERDFINPNTYEGYTPSTPIGPNAFKVFFYLPAYVNALKEIFGFSMKTVEILYPPTAEFLDNPRKARIDVSSVVYGQALEERIAFLESQIQAELQRLSSLPSPLEFSVDGRTPELERWKLLRQERTFLANFVETYLKNYSITDGASFVTPNEYLDIITAHKQYDEDTRDDLTAYLSVLFYEEDDEQTIEEKLQFLKTVREKLVKKGVRLNGLKLLVSGMLDFQGTKATLTVKSAQHRLPALGPRSFLGWLNNKVMLEEGKGIFGSVEEMKTIKPQKHSFLDPSKWDVEQNVDFYAVPRHFMRLQHDLPTESYKSKIGVQLLKLLFQDFSYEKSDLFEFPTYLTLASKDLYGISEEKKKFSASEFIDAARRVIKGQLFERIKSAGQTFELDTLRELYLDKNKSKAEITRILNDTVIKKGADISVNTQALTSDIYQYLELSENGFYDVPVYAVPGGENVITAFFGSLLKKLTVHRVNGGEFTEVPVITVMQYDKTSDDWKFDPVFSRYIVKTGLSDWDGKRPLKDVRIEIENGKRVVKPAEIIITWNFRHPDGTLMDMNDFIGENGNINLELIDPVLLQGIYYRTPTQSSSFVTPYVVVGFIPPPEGLYILHAPAQQARYGMDYDADVIRFINYHHRLVVETVGTKAKFKRKRLALDDTSERKRLDNAFVDLWKVKLTVTDALFEGSNEYLMDELYELVPKEGMLTKMTHMFGNPVAQVIQNNELLAGKANIGLTVSMASMFYHLFMNGVKLKKPLNPNPKLVLSWGVVAHPQTVATSFTYNGEYIPAIINTLVSLMVDNAKNNHAGINNINIHTIPMIVYMTMTGYSFKDTIFIVRSFIGRLFTAYSSKSGNVMIKEVKEENFVEFFKEYLLKDLKSKGRNVDALKKRLDEYTAETKSKKEKEAADKIKPVFRMDLVYPQDKLFESPEDFGWETADEDKLLRLMDAAKWIETINVEASGLRNLNSRIFRAYMTKSTSNLSLFLDSLRKWKELVDMVEKPETSSGMAKVVDGISIARYNYMVDAVVKDSEFVEVTEIFSFLADLMSINGQILPDPQTYAAFVDSLKELKRFYKVPARTLDYLIDLVKSRQIVYRYLRNFEGEKLYEEAALDVLFDREPLGEFDDKDNLSKERMQKLSLKTLYDLIWEKYADKATQNLYFASIRRSDSLLPLFLSVSTSNMDLYGIEGIQNEFMHLFEGRWTAEIPTDKKDPMEKNLLETFVTKLVTYTLLFKNYETAKSSFIRTIPAKILKTFLTQDKTLDEPPPSMSDLTLLFMTNFPEQFYPLSVDDALMRWNSDFKLTKKEIVDVDAINRTIRVESENEKPMKIFFLVELKKSDYSIYSLETALTEKKGVFSKTLKFEGKALFKRIFSPFPVSVEFAQKVNAVEQEAETLDAKISQKEIPPPPIDDPAEIPDELAEYFEPILENLNPPSWMEEFYDKDPCQ
jgi:hypothetical protein